jgi:hypothetical protein
VIRRKLAIYKMKKSIDSQIKEIRKLSKLTSKYLPENREVMDVLNDLITEVDKLLDVYYELR